MLFNNFDGIDQNVKTRNRRLKLFAIINVLNTFTYQHLPYNP